jgi:hypothetical protein
MMCDALMLAGKMPARTGKMPALPQSAAREKTDCGKGCGVYDGRREANQENRDTVLMFTKMPGETRWASP